MLNRIDRILLRVPNLSLAVKFYETVLGLRLDRQHSGVAAMKFAEGNQEIILHNDAHRQEMEICFAVDNVRVLYEERQARGLNFLSPPVEVARGWRATLRDPFGHALVILDHQSQSDIPSIEPIAHPATGLFENIPAIVSEDRDAIVRVYSEVGRTADDLPYTPHFETLYTNYIKSLPDPKPSHADVWKLLLTLRKRKGGLPSLGPARSKPPSIDTEAKDRLKELLGTEIGKRDRLPYTAKFDSIVAEFNKHFSRNYSPHTVWRLVATLAK